MSKKPVTATLQRPCLAWLSDACGYVTGGITEDPTIEDGNRLQIRDQRPRFTPVAGEGVHLKKVEISENQGGTLGKFVQVSREKSENFPRVPLGFHKFQLSSNALKIRYRGKSRSLITNLDTVSIFSGRIFFHFFQPQPQGLYLIFNDFGVEKVKK